MQATDRIRAFEVSDGARDFQHPVVSACREPKCVGGIGDEGLARRIWRGMCVQILSRRIDVQKPALWTCAIVSLTLPGPGGGDARRDL